MSALTADQIELLQAASRCLLTVSGSRYYVDGVQCDVALSWAAADMVADGLLFLPDWARPGKYRPVHASATGIDALTAARTGC